MSINTFAHRIGHLFSSWKLHNIHRICKKVQQELNWLVQLIHMGS